MTLQGGKPPRDSNAFRLPGGCGTCPPKVPESPSAGRSARGEAEGLFENAHRHQLQFLAVRDDFRQLLLKPAELLLALPAVFLRFLDPVLDGGIAQRSEEHTSLQ